MLAASLLFKSKRALGRFTGRFWNATLGYVSQFLCICALFYRLLVNTFSTLTGFRLVWRQTAQYVYITAIKGAHVLIFSALMLGLIVIVHATQQLVKIQGEEFVGWLLVTIVVRELGPVWAAFFVLLHSGAAITVEIGTMSVTHQMDTLRMMGIDPYRYLGVSRLWGLTLGLMGLYILLMITAVMGGFIFAQIFAEVFWAKFWLSLVNALQWIDLAIGLAKTALFGLFIATVSIYYGFQARDNLDEVAQGAASASLTSLVLCGSLDIIITTAYYL
ncbi:MAG: ABC transporter permease [Thermodesulfobacteriota bacterium]